MPILSLRVLLEQQRLALWASSAASRRLGGVPVGGSLLIGSYRSVVVVNRGERFEVPSDVAPMFRNTVPPPSPSHRNNRPPPSDEPMTQNDTNHNNNSYRRQEEEEAQPGGTAPGNVTTHEIHIPETGPGPANRAGPSAPPAAGDTTSAASGAASNLPLMVNSEELFHQAVVLRQSPKYRRTAHSVIVGGRLSIQRLMYEYGKRPSVVFLPEEMDAPEMTNVTTTSRRDDEEALDASTALPEWLMRTAAVSTETGKAPTQPPAVTDVAPPVVVRVPRFDILDTLLSTSSSDAVAAKFDLPPIPPVDEVLRLAPPRAAPDAATDASPPNVVPNPSASSSLSSGSLKTATSCGAAEDNEACFKRVIVMHKVNIPSNMGRLCHLSVQYGFTSMILDQCCDPYGEKVIRSSLGYSLSPLLKISQLHRSTSFGQEEAQQRALVRQLEECAIKHQLLPVVAVAPLGGRTMTMEHRVDGGGGVENVFSAAQRFHTLNAVVSKREAEAEELKRRRRQRDASAAASGIGEGDDAPKPQETPPTTASGSGVGHKQPPEHLGVMLFVGSESQGPSGLLQHWNTERVPLKYVTIPMEAPSTRSGDSSGLNVAAALSIVMRLFSKGTAKEMVDWAKVSAEQGLPVLTGTASGSFPTPLLEVPVDTRDDSTAASSKGPRSVGHAGDTEAAKKAPPKAPGIATFAQTRKGASVVAIESADESVDNLSSEPSAVGRGGRRGTKGVTEDNWHDSIIDDEDDEAAKFFQREAKHHSRVKKAAHRARIAEKQNGSSTKKKNMKKGKTQNRSRGGRAGRARGTKA